MKRYDGSKMKKKAEIPSLDIPKEKHVARLFHGIAVPSRLAVGNYQHHNQLRTRVKVKLKLSTQIRLKAR